MFDWISLCKRLFYQKQDQSSRKTWSYRLLDHFGEQQTLVLYRNLVQTILQSASMIDGRLQNKMQTLIYLSQQSAIRILVSMFRKDLTTWAVLKIYEKFVNLIANILLSLGIFRKLQIRINFKRDRLSTSVELFPYHPVWSNTLYFWTSLRMESQAFWEDFSENYPWIHFDFVNTGRWFGKDAEVFHLVVFIA